MEIRQRQFEKEYFDVLNGEKDVIDSYLTTIPEQLYNNQLKLNTNDYDNFATNHLKQKKELELKIIQQNMKQELNEQIYDMAKPDPRELKRKERNRLLR